jgi:hypothetical protein
MRRRRFLHIVGQTGGALLAGSLIGCSRCAGGRGEDAPSTTTAPVTTRAGEPGLRVFDEHRRPIAEAMIDRLFPATPPGPGAKQLGVLGYLDGQLALPRFEAERELVSRGLLYLDAVARREQANQRFHVLPDPVKDEILSRFQLGRLTGASFPTHDFFEVMLAFTLEGVFGDPRHGGNRDKLAWRWLELDPSCGQMHACGG